LPEHDGPRGKKVSGIRIIAIAIGALIAAELQYGLGMQWYVSVPLGVLGYLAARSIGWAITERRASAGK
jgi:hypothetical protein